MRLRVVVPLLALAAACRGDAPAPPPRGDDAAAARNYQQRLEESPDDPVLLYNLGTSILRMGRFDAAKPPLEAAAEGAEDPGVREAAYYNLGSADLEPAFAARAGGASREGLERAIAAYKGALLLDPGDGDSKWNLELARRLLADLVPPPPDPGGGGGGGRGGGGSGEDPRSGRQDPLPGPAGASGPQPPLSRSEAERLLASAQERETGLQRDKLRKPQPRSTRAH